MVLFSQRSLVALAKVSQITDALSTDAEVLGKQLVSAGYQGIPGNYADDPIAHMLRDRGLNIFSIEKAENPELSGVVVASITVAGHPALVELPAAVAKLWQAFHDGGWPELVRHAFRESHSAKLVTMSAAPITARYNEHRDDLKSDTDESAAAIADSSASPKLTVGSPASGAVPQKRGRGRPRKHPAKIERS